MASKPTLSTTTLIAGSPPTDRLHPSLPNSSGVVLSLATAMMTVSVAPLPSGAEIVLAVVGKACNFWCNALSVSSSGISVVVTAHSSSIPATPGMAINLES